MAEIGLVASIFSVTAVGISVATTLYETADAMVNADQQIKALAKHVLQFTAVLKHMGQVLETERTSCFKELLRDIRKIKHSCKRTFREINSTVKSKRSRYFVAVKWLFTRTKAMEIEARLDSQQSMLQCIIQTLTVSKLGRIDSRSKQDFENITGLNVEIKLLKIFIMESYYNLTELRRAEQSMEAEARYKSPAGGYNSPGVHHPYGDGSTFPPNPIGGSNAYEPPIMRSPSPTSSASKSENEVPHSDNGADVDTNSTKSKDQSDQDNTVPTHDTSNTEGLISKCSLQPRSFYNDALGPAMHRESDLLLQMVPYRPRLSNQIRSDRLIPGGQGPDSDTKSTTQEATNSVRLLLDKWTTSGSAPVSSSLDEEAAREQNQAELADKRRTSDPRLDTNRRSPLPGAESNQDDFGPTHYPALNEYSPPFQDDHMPPAPPWENSQQQYGGFPSSVSGPRRREFWRPSQPFAQPPHTQLGVEILAALRSTKGGIYYTKSNQFKQVHYVDQYPIYTCAFVPSDIVPDNGWRPRNTELGRGSIRREALDLLGYSYIETETGNFSISDDLELVCDRFPMNDWAHQLTFPWKREIEELVNLSYQALDRYSRERSKTVIKERGWIEAVDAMNRMPIMYPDKPSAAPQYSPPREKSWNQNNPPYSRYSAHRPFTEYENFWLDESAPSQAPLPRPRPRERTSVDRRARPILTSPPMEFDRQEQDATKTTRPEVRFTLPRAQIASSTAHTAKEAQPSPVKPDVAPTRTDEELQQVLQRLDKAKKRKAEAEKAKDFSTVSDISNYAIPDLEERIGRLRKQQHEEQEKRSAPVSQNKENRKSRHTGVETESEYSDDEGGSGVLEEYDRALEEGSGYS